MVVVVFEVEPTLGQRDTYLNLAAQLKSLLEQVDGLISVERFQSITNPDKMLLLSPFRDEEAVKVWHNLGQHCNVQHVGRDHAFTDYCLRIARVVRDYGMINRDEALTDNHAEHA